jgi:5'-nucleotidase
MTALIVRLLILLLVLPGCVAARGSRDVRLVTIVAVSDWHGQLEPLTVSIEGQDREAGGAAILKYYFDRERRRNPDGTLVVTAGDAFGATPPISSLFEDVPAVEAQNAMGFDIDTLGNHNFDHGLDRLEKLMRLARFPYVAANIAGPDGRTLAPPYQLFTKNGVRVGVIGIGNPETPLLVQPGHTGSYRFLDPVPVINGYAKELRDRGTEIVMVIAHMGAHSAGADGVPTGPLGHVAKAVRGADVLIGDHTNVSVNTVVNDMIVVENASKGVQYTVIDLEYDVTIKRVVARSVVQKWALAEGAVPDQAVQRLIDTYKARLAPLLDRKVAETATVLTHSRQQASSVGNLLADALRQRYRAQLGFVVSGAIRADIPSGYRPADTRLRRTGLGYAAGPPYDIVAGDFVTAFPFGNDAVTFTITGRTLWEALEHGVSRVTVEGTSVINTDGRFLQISGFRFSYDPAKPPSQRVAAVTLADGTPVPGDGTTYTAVTIDFVYSGGDGYTMLNNGSGTTREPVVEIVSQTVEETGTLRASTEERIKALGAYSTNRW